MSAPTKSYYIDINRFSAQDNDSDQPNIWDYNLNDTIVAPMGSEISVHQAFLNQKGITGQSIEFEEDVSETINYYGYVAEMEQIVPVLQDPLETKRGERHDVNDQYWGYLNLLNNAVSGGAAANTRGNGRQSLWGITSTLTEGAIQHLDAAKFGGSGTPLILSDPPTPDNSTEFSYLVSVTPPNSLGGSVLITPQAGLNKFTITPASMDALRNRGQLRFVGAVHFGAIVSGAVPSPNGFTRDRGGGATLLVDTQIDYDPESATYGHGTFNNGWSVADDGAIQEYNVEILNAASFAVGAIGLQNRVDSSQRLPKVGDRVYDRENNTIIPMGTKVSAITDGMGVGSQIICKDNADNLIDFNIIGDRDQAVKDNRRVYFNSDMSYYSSPRPLQAQISIPKGVYGIQQLVSLVNAQLSGIASPNSKVPQKPYDSGLISGNYDGMINQGTQGFTTKIKPLRYRDAPDSIHKIEIDPNLNVNQATKSIPDHTFIPAWDYADSWDSRKALNQPNRVNFTSKISGTGYIGYLMDNAVQGVESNGLTLKTLNVGFNVAGFQYEDIGSAANANSADETPPEDSNVASKAISDYQIGNPDIASITVGSPEANIQFDTDTSSFSINNLHASWRIPSHDVLGAPIPNKGEVGVGLKRCAQICDAQPYSKYQTLWGYTGRDNLTDDNSVLQLRGKINPDTNILSSIRFQDRGGNAAMMSFMTIGAKLEPVDVGSPGDSFRTSSSKLPVPDGNEYVEIIEIVPAAIKDIYSAGSKGYPAPSDPIGFYSVRVKFPTSWDSNSQQFKDFTDAQRQICFKVTGQGSATTTERQQMISSYQRPKSRTGGVVVYNFAQKTALKYGDRTSVVGAAEYSQHASFREFFSSKKQAEKIWKTKTLWGKLGFSYQQFNEEDYFENIVQYCKPTNYRLRGITTDTVLDASVIPTISTIANPSDFTIEQLYGKLEVTNPQTFNNFDFNTPRTELQRDYPTASGGHSSQMPMTGSNQKSYSGSIHTFTAMTNVVAKPTPISAEGLPTLSKFGYYLITSDLVPTYKDIVSKGDPLGLLGVVPKTSLSSQDFIPLANSDIVQVLSQDTQINNIRVKILNPDLTNPALNENSSVILRIDVPIQQPTPNTEEDTKTPKKKCPKTGHKICKCPPTSIEKISKK
tara:strand:+ start:6973 stop:10422 length:3450 start_codon:yes stop_codon:yes gene_type:complete